MSPIGWFVAWKKLVFANDNAYSVTQHFKSPNKTLLEIRLHALNNLLFKIFDFGLQSLLWGK